MTRTHGVTLETPVGEEDAIVLAASAALARFELDRPVRLLGVRASFVRGTS